MKPMRIIIEILFWMLMALIALIAVSFITGWLLTPIIGYIALVGLLVLLPVTTRLVRLVRKRRATAVMSYLEQAVRLNLPISRLLAAARESETGKLAYRIEQVRRRLEEGFPIGDAARRALPELSDDAAALLISGERLGRLPHALRKVLRDQTSAAREQVRRGGFLSAYPFMMIIVLGAVIFMITVYVLPKYETIYAGFGMKLPPLTILLFEMSRSLGVIALSAMVAAMLWWAGLGLWEMFAPSATWALWREVRDRALWALPLAHGVTRDRGLADAFDLIAEALRGGATAERALAEAAQLRVNAVLRRRLQRWADALAAGVTLHAGAKAARMPSLVVEMLSAQRGPETVDVFAFLARHYAARFSRGAALLAAATGPIMVFFFAMLVAWVAVALFSPMCSLINNLSGHAGTWQL